jgi:phosphate acyltransferase
LDVPGGDLPEQVKIKGALDALQENEDLSIILVGNQSVISQEIASTPSSLKNRIEIYHTNVTIDMGESPSHILKQKKNSSLSIAVELVKNKQANAIVSAGNTGAQMAASLFLLGRLSSIDRPAIAITVPCMNGSFVLLDAGANTDLKAQHLFDFARMGYAYAKIFYHKDQPSIGLLNNGTEKEKGNKLTKEAFPLLSQLPSFYGFIEGREMMDGLCDVVVCDGFTGNIVLKTIEGVAQSLMSWLKEELRGSVTRKIAALFLKASFRKLKHKLDYRVVGGAPLLGVNGISIICHGSSDALAIKNAILLATKLHQESLINQISSF